MNKNYFLLLILLIIQTYSCKKSTEDNSSMHIGVAPNVYVAGFENGLAVYWKNDSAVNLGGGVELNGISVSGNDVYVAGTADKTGFLNTVAAYWKNDSLVTLSDGSNQISANSIFVSGNDVYVAGSEVTETGISPNYWKNGVTVILSANLSGIAYSIYVSGNDVYVAGNVYNGARDVLVYWKNGNYVVLDTTDAFLPRSISVSGNDVYLAGYTLDGVAEYWKNGNRVIFLILPEMPKRLPCLYPELMYMWQVLKVMERII